MKRILLLLSVLSFMHWGTHAQNCNDPVFSINEGFTLDQDVDGFFAEVLPDCWSRAYPQGANDQEGRIRRNSDGSNAFLQVASGNGSGGDNGIALMPEPANYLGQLSFRAKTSSGSALFDVELVLYSGGTNVRFLRSFSLNRNWQDFNVDLGNLLDGFVATGNEVSLGFRHTDANKSFTYSMDIDDVVYTSGCPTDPAAVARTQNITVELDETGNATITPEDIDNGSTDECGDPIASLALDITSFDCSNLGDNTVTLTATTAGGEVDTETAIVRVLPDLPVLNDSIDVYLDEMGSVSIAVEDFTTADACTGVTYTFGSATQTTFVCEVVNRRFTV
ncbi:MAG: hypothetical protein HRT61_11845, partial [Ekhidna sp.]|nr:hypothetical protein [Ekhidna sp.]